YGAKQCVAAFPSSYPDLFGLPDYRAPDYNPQGMRRHKPLSKIPTLIPCAIDQEPYFRILRDRCDRMTDPHPKTCLILSKFLTALQGPGGKMSASDANSAIFMSDTAAQIKNKINRHAFSGGRESLEEHRQLGGNPDVDVAFTYLSYFLESDAELAELANKYRSGEMLTGEMKQRCIAELQTFVGAFQERRAKVDHGVMREYMRPRKLVWGGNPSPTKPAGKSEEGGGSGEGAAGDGAGGEKRADGRGTKGERKAAKRAAQKEEKLAARPKQAQQAQGGEGEGGAAPSASVEAS
ncbi:Nucleotidylyl transferase, partial [Hortaea werneckii]